MDRAGITNTENGLMSLSLISQFCDARLKEMSNICSVEPSHKKKHSSIYSNVLASSSSSIQSSNEQLSGIYVQDSSDPEVLQNHLHKKVKLSQHIKPISITEWMHSEEIGKSTDGCQLNEANNFNEDGDAMICGGGDCEEEESGCNNNDINLLAKERLESYLPILRDRVKSGKWSELNAIPSLEILRSCSNLSDKNVMQSNELHAKPSESSSGECCCNWDSQQGCLLRSTKEQMVLYGLIEKPYSIKSQRLRKLFDSIGVASLPLQSMMVSQKQLYLVDGTAKIKLRDLSGKLKYAEVVSGVVVAIMGKLSGIHFLVEGVIFATPASPEWPIPGNNNIEMVFVSGLNLGNEIASNLTLDLLQDYLLGLSGSVYEQKNVSISRVRLFLVGNMITKSTRGRKGESDVEKITENYMKALTRLDNFLKPLVQTMEVFCIPGENDLTLTSTLPQPPLAPKLLSETGLQPSLKRLTNPSRVQVSITESSSHDSSKATFSQPECSLLESSYGDFLKDDVHFIDMLFQSGGNIKETMDYCDITCPVDMAIRLLKWGHLHPTYCDNKFDLAKNLFRLQGTLPHVVAIGNLSEFKCVSWKNTQVVGIPAFHNSHTAVVLTKDFNVIPISFKLI